MARGPGHAVRKADVGTPAAWVEAEAKEVGLDVAGYSHVIDGSAVRHVVNRHSNPKVETAQGPIAVTDADFEAAPEVIGDPDAIILGDKNKRGQEVIIYLKQLPSGMTLCVEEVRTGRREMAMTSMRRFPAARDLRSVAGPVLSYARSGGRANAKIVYAPPPVNKP